MHPLDTAIELKAAGADRFTGATSPAYGNMVGPFGGITSSLLLNAVLQHPHSAGVPIALTVNFAAPIEDGAIDLTVRAARINRSTQHWIAEASQDGLVVALATAVLAERRATWSALQAQAPQNLPAPHELKRMSTAGMPAWTRCYDMRVISGGIEGRPDGQEQAEAVSCLWVRDDPPRPVDFLSLAAVCDSFFPRIFIRRRRLAPIGTVSLTTYFHADDALLTAQADNYMLGVADALAFRNGFFDQSAQIWSSNGDLMASAHQIVYFRD